eukprot:gene40278-49078_t
MASTLIVWWLLVACLGAAIAETVNKEVSIAVDATTAIIRVATEIKASVDNAEYLAAFPQAWAQRLAHMAVVVNGKPVTFTQLAHAELNATAYAIPVPTDGSLVTIKITSVFTDLLEPYPAEIAQDEAQLVRLHTSHTLLSPYATSTQKTTVRLPSASIEGYTARAPSSVKGSSVVLGPYKDVPALAPPSPCTLHFSSSAPFARFNSVVREVEVSHWGGVSVEEVYDLKHYGARLKGGFSRFDFQLRRGGPSHSFRSLTA